MNRFAPVVVAVIILVTPPVDSHRHSWSSCFVQSKLPVSRGTTCIDGTLEDKPFICTRRIHTIVTDRRHNELQGCQQPNSNIPRNNKVLRRRRRLSTMYMNKIPNIFGSADDERNNVKKGSKLKQEQEEQQRGILQRIRDKISTTFQGERKEDRNNSSSRRKDKNESLAGNKDIGYKPTALDALRLRLAIAMSGLSNLNLFQSGKEEWVVACPKTRVGPGQIVPCSVNGLDIIIFASRDGQRLDAFANACPHLGSPFDLATIERKPPVNTDTRGKVMDDGTDDRCVDCIVCPVHQTAFEIQSGQVSGEWCPYPPILGGVMGYLKPKSGLVKFAVRLRGKNVEVRIATPMKNVEEGDEQARGLRRIK